MEYLQAIVFGSLIVAVVGIVMWIVGMGQDIRGKEENLALLIPGFLMAIVFGIAAVIFGIIWGTTYYGSYNDIQRLSAFHNETLSAYEYTVDRTESVVIDASRTRGTSITDFSYQEQGKATSERIKEMRDEVAMYNRDLYVLLGKNRIPVIGAMYKDVPEDLKPIKIEISQ